MKVQIKGVKQLIRQLDNLDKGIRNKALKKALREGCKLIQKEAKKSAPKGETGNLRKSIKVRAGKSKNGKTSLTVQIGRKNFQGPSFYGGFIDQGAPNRHIVAREFLQRAMDAKKEQARAKIIDVLQAEIKRLVA